MNGESIVKFEERKEWKNNVRMVLLSTQICQFWDTGFCALSGISYKALGTTDVR